MKGPLRIAVLISHLLLVTALGWAQKNEAPKDSARPEMAVTAPGGTARSVADPEAPPSVLKMFRGGPLRFERNAGQFDSQVKFTSRGLAHSLFLTPSEAVLVLTRQAAPAKGSAWRDHERIRAREETTRTVARFKLAGANAAPAIEGEELLPGRSNYLIGRDQNRWHTGVENFARVRYREVYPDIDWVYYGNEGQVEYDFVVLPGGDPSQIAMAVALDGSGGKDAFRISPEGDLILATEPEGIKFHRPIAYQMLDGQKQIVSAEFTAAAPGRVGFKLGKYDLSRPVIIDPVLTFSTYLGGVNGDASAFAVAVDATGIYVAGQTNAGIFPTTAGVVQPTPGSGSVNCFSGTDPDPCFDAFVSKLTPDGTSMIFSTFLGGSSLEGAFGIATSSSGEVFVTGLTVSQNFPITASAFQPNIAPGVCQRGSNPTYNCEDAFATVLNSDGTALLYSTFLGGSDIDFGNSIAVDTSGNFFVTGEAYSTDFPANIGTATGGTCPNSVPCGDGFVGKFDPAASGAASRLFMRYLGGQGDDYPGSIAVQNATGDAIVAGVTTANSSSVNTFPIVGGFQTTFRGGFADAFIAKIKGTDASLLYSSYLGGTDDDQGTSVALDSTGMAFITGYTHSSDFQVKNAVQSTRDASSSSCTTFFCYDAFLAKFDTSLTGANSLLFSTYLGGSDDDRALSVAVDSSGNPVISGATATPQTGVTRPFPLASPLQSTKAGILGEYDGFVTRLTSTGSSIPFSTYFGGGGDFDVTWGVKVGPTDEIVFAGRTNSATLPVTLNSFEPAAQGIAEDAFVGRIDTGNLPGAAFSSDRMAFGSIELGLTTTVRSVVLSNMGTAALTIIITTTGTHAADFDLAGSSTCGASVAAGSKCQVDMTFTPSAIGTRNAILTVSDNAAGSPHQIALTGTGQAGPADFTLTRGTASVTLDAGQTANYVLTLTPVNGFNQQITFSCSGQPVRSTCNPPPATTLDGTNPTDVTLSVVTQSRAAAPPMISPFKAPPLTAPQSYLPWLAIWLMVAATILKMAGRKRRTVLLLTATLVTALAWSACGGGGGGGTTPPPTGTPAGTYTITATATSGSITKTTTVSLTVR